MYNANEIVTTKTLKPVAQYEILRIIIKNNFPSRKKYRIEIE